MDAMATNSDPRARRSWRTEISPIVKTFVLKYCHYAANWRQCLFACDFPGCRWRPAVCPVCFCLGWLWQRRKVYFLPRRGWETVYHVADRCQGVEWNQRHLHIQTAYFSTSRHHTRLRWSRLRWSCDSHTARAAGYEGGRWVISVKLNKLCGFSFVVRHGQGYCRCSERVFCGANYLSLLKKTTLNESFFENFPQKYFFLNLNLPRKWLFTSKILLKNVPPSTSSIGNSQLKEISLCFLCF